MANTSVPITAGSGTNIAVNAVGGLDMQVVKIDIGADGASLALVGDATYGLPCDVKRLAGNVTVVQGTATNLKVDASGVAVPITDNGGSLTVDAPVAAPVHVRLSDGTNNIDTIPVSGTVAATQSGGWAAQITDGTHNAHLTLVSATYALDVNVVSSVAIGGTALADGGTVTAGTTLGNPIAGVYNDGIASPSSGKNGLVRITANRALHANPRNASGAEIGTAASPIFVSPATSPNSQPVTGTVTSDQGAAGVDPWAANLTKLGGDVIAKVGTGIQVVAVKDSAGAAVAETNPLPTYQAKTPHTRVSKTVALSASQTAAAVWTPTGGKKFFVKKIILIVSVTGVCSLFDQTDASGTILAKGTWLTGTFQLNFEEPYDSAAVDNVLSYTSGTGFTAVITAHGWEE